MYFLSCLANTENLGVLGQTTLRTKFPPQNHTCMYIPHLCTRIPPYATTHIRTHTHTHRPLSKQVRSETRLSRLPTRGAEQESSGHHSESQAKANRYVSLRPLNIHSLKRLLFVCTYLCSKHEN